MFKVDVKFVNNSGFLDRTYYVNETNKEKTVEQVTDLLTSKEIKKLLGINAEEY